MMRLLSVALTIGAVLLIAVPASRTEETGHEYVGSKNCKKCHIKEHKSWAATKMAKAYDSLKPGVAKEQKAAVGLDPDKDYTKDAECLSCHTTGYGKAGGFVDIATTPELAGVGCESCHGAGGTYVQDQYMSLKNKNYKREDIVAVGMVGEITAENCTTQCHNEKSPFAGDDYQFDFETMRQKDAHENFPLKYQH
jgi:cytochrome c553